MIIMGIKGSLLQDYDDETNLMMIIDRCEEIMVRMMILEPPEEPFDPPT